MPGERVAVGSQPRRRKADDGVSGAHPVRAELGAALDDSDGESRQVEVVDRHHPGMLGRLTSDQRAPGQPAALVDARHHGRDAVGVDPAGDHVVEEEQGLRADADEVVHAHGHEVDADGLVAPGRPRHLELGTDAVGRGHEHRVVVARRVERELAGEPADARHHAPQPFDRGLARGDVDAGRGIAGAAGRPLAHALRPRAARPGTTGARTARNGRE